MPATQSTAPGPSTDDSVITTMFNSVNTAAATIKTTMGTDHSRIYLNYSNSSFYSWYARSNSTITPYVGGDSQIQFLTYGEYNNNQACIGFLNTPTAADDCAEVNSKTNI